MALLDEYLPYLMAGGAALQQMGENMQPSRMPRNQFGGLLSTLGAGASGYATGSMLAPKIGLLNQQYQQAQDWQKLWGAPGGAAPQQMDPGVQGPPMPSTAQRLGLPDAIVPYIGAMGPEKGSAVLADAAKRLQERDAMEPITDAQGRTIGQRNRLTGEEKFRPTELVQQFTPETRNINGQEVPGQIDNFTKKWTPLDPATTRLTVNNDLRGPQAGEVQSAKDLSELGKADYEMAQAARRQHGQLQMTGNILANGTTTGMGTETKMAIANFVKSNTGVELDKNLPQQEMLQNLGQAMAIDAAPKGQGAVSNYERDLFAKAVAVQMGRSTEGNKKLVEYYKRIKKQDAEVGKLYEDELAKNGRVTTAYLKAKREHYEKPLFSPDEIKDLTSMAGAQPAAPEPGGKARPANDPLGLFQ